MSGLGEAGDLTAPLPPIAAGAAPGPSLSPEGERGPANPVRGEAGLRVGGITMTLRPTFGALVAAEAEIGPLFELVDRAAAGKLTLAELAVLFWHCLVDRPPHLTREGLGEAVAMAGLTAVAPVLRHLLGQILAGR